MNLPNKLTLLRILLIPVFIAFFYLPIDHRLAFAAGIFLLAYLTDILDGALARKRNQITNFGKLMDPVADKLLTCSAFIMLVAEGFLSPIAAIIVVGREFLISGFRLIAIDAGNVIAASWLGKLKTITQCIAVVLLLVWPMLNLPAFRLDTIVLWISVAITVWSGVDYILKNRGHVNFH